MFPLKDNIIKTFSIQSLRNKDGKMDSDRPTNETKQDNYFKRNFEKLIALASFLVAAISLSVAIDQGIQARKHNELSIQPRLTFNRIFNDGQIKFILKNYGLGTAIVKEMKVWYKGEEIEHLGLAVAQIEKELPTYESSPRHQKLFGEGTLPSDASIEILFFNMLNMPPEEREKFRKAVSRIDLRIKYQSLYQRDEWLTKTEW